MKCVCSNLRKGGESSLQRIALDGGFTAILVALGMIKLPSLFPGAEFQLSAPYAVCLAAMIGFKRYLIIGICSSIIQLLLGTHTIWNVLVAMVFRIAAGLIVTKCPVRKFSIPASGPIGTGCARFVLAVMLKVPVMPLLAAAVPGMIFTAVCASAMEPVLRRVLSKSGAQLYEKKVGEASCE